MLRNPSWETLDRASWRGLTAVDPVGQVAVLSFDIKGQEQPLRLLISARDLMQIAGAVSDVLKSDNPEPATCP